MPTRASATAMASAARAASMIGALALLAGLAAAQSPQGQQGQQPAPAGAPAKPGGESDFIVKPPAAVDPALTKPAPAGKDPGLVKTPPAHVQDAEPNGAGKTPEAPSAPSRRDGCKEPSAKDCEQKPVR